MFIPWFHPHVKLRKCPNPPGCKAPQPPKVSVVVVSYNRKALLQRALTALEHSEARGSMDVVVVDNGSTDGKPATRTRIS